MKGRRKSEKGEKGKNKKGKWKMKEESAQGRGNEKVQRNGQNRAMSFTFTLPKAIIQNSSKINKEQLKKGKIASTSHISITGFLTVRYGKMSSKKKIFA